MSQQDVIAALLGGQRAFPNWGGNKPVVGGAQMFSGAGSPFMQRMMNPSPMMAMQPQGRVSMFSAGINPIENNALGMTSQQPRRTLFGF